VKKPTKKPEWYEFEQEIEFSDEGIVYGLVEPFRAAWQGTFNGKPAGIGATKEEAKRKVEEAYERWLGR
jgi:hypothetical protein